MSSGNFGNFPFGGGPFGGPAVPSLPVVTPPAPPVIPVQPSVNGTGTASQGIATIRYRALDANGDPMWGGGQSNFLADVDAVAQAIQTRILLLYGEWFEDLSIGTPLFQSMLGSPGNNVQAVSLLIQQRILGAPYVNSVSNVQTGYDPASRTGAFFALAQTKFGTVTISNQPASSATVTTP